MNDLSNASRARPREDLLAPATQIVRNRADYLGEGQDDVGQRVADDKLELFVAVDPAQAMLQQFAQLQPEFIVLHDVGLSQSMRLLNSIATALNTKVQTLAIRRQGHGVALAVLPFVELPGRGNQHLRVYSTDVDTDSQSRKALASVLLGHARLGVLLVGEMPSHLMAAALQPIREAIMRGPWPNHELLLVPHGSAAHVSSQIGALAIRPGLNVLATSPAPTPNDAWTYVTGAWNRLRESTAPAARPAAVSPTSEEPTEAMPLPEDDAPLADATSGRWKAYLEACSALKGLVSACVFDYRSAKALAHRGSRPEAAKLVAQGVRLYGTLAESGRQLGLGPSQPDAAVTLTGHHLLLHPLPGHPGIILHAVLDASIANLTLARMQLQRVDTSLLG